MARKIAAGTAAMAKRSAPSSSGPKAARPARIAGKAEAQPTTVSATASTAVISVRCSEFAMLICALIVLLHPV